MPTLTISNRDDEIAYEIIKRLDLKPVSARFDFFINGRLITIIWDGAGLNEKGSLVLVEVEKGEINESHIKNHMLNILLMVNQGKAVDTVIWVTRRGALNILKAIVGTWKIVLESACRIKLPKMNYLSL